MITKTWGLHRISSFNEILAIFLFFPPIATALIQVLIITYMDHGRSHLTGPSASRRILFHSFSTQSPNDLFKMHTTSTYPIVEYHSKVINVLVG